jgi:hypothetical protein
MAVYTYLRNQDPSERTGILRLRGGALQLGINQYADLTQQEYDGLKDRYVLAPGQVSGASPAVISSRYLLSNLPVQAPSPSADGQTFYYDEASGAAIWGTPPALESRLNAVEISSDGLGGHGPNELGYKPIKLGIVVGPGSSGAWDEAFVEGGQVFWDPGQQRWGMVFVGYSGVLSGGFPPAGSLGKVGLAWSDDLLTWTKDPANPIFQGTGGVGVDWDGGTVTAPLMYVENGVYYLFYIAVPSAGWEASGGGQLKLGVATASSANGPFTRAPGNPLISPTGSGTAWRSNHIFHPSVVKVRGLYYCFFNASRLSDNKEQIGYAYASSLLGPWTVDDAHSPVLTAAASGWDSNLVIDPFVFRAPDGTWFMAYSGNSAGGGYVNDGYAWTTDAEFPLNWRRHAANPFLSSDKLWDASVCGKPCIIRNGGACFHFHTVRDVSTNPSQIGLAVKGIRGLMPKHFIGGSGEPAFGTNWGSQRGRFRGAQLLARRR